VQWAFDPGKLSFMNQRPNHTPQDREKKRDLVRFVVVGLGLLIICALGAESVISNFQQVIGSDEAKYTFEVMMDQAKTRGRDFGLTTDENGCVKTGSEKAVECDKSEMFEIVRCGKIDSVFLNACLEHAKPSETFCTFVPEFTDGVSAAEWQKDTCNQTGYSQSLSCRKVYEIVAEHCAARRKATP
jgi:hypothetical protein